MIAQYGEVQPNRQVAYKGDDVIITCTSATPPTWSKQGQAVKKERIHYNFVIINNAMEYHSGIYTCTGTHTNGTAFTSDSEVFIGGESCI